MAKITNKFLAQAATKTLKGNGTGSTANVTDLTVAQVNAILPVFTSTLNGLAPLSGGGTTNFLRADGTWAAPASGSTASNLRASLHSNISGFSLPTGGVVIYDTVDSSAGSDISYNTSNGQISIATGGQYLISAGISVFMGSGTVTGGFDRAYMQLSGLSISPYVGTQTPLIGAPDVGRPEQVFLQGSVVVQVASTATVTMNFGLIVEGSGGISSGTIVGNASQTFITITKLSS